MVRPSSIRFELRAGEEPPPRVRRGVPSIPWAEHARMLKANKGNWATIGPWRSTNAASGYAKRIANGKIPELEGRFYELEPRRMELDDGTKGSVLWIRYVSA